MAITQNNKKKHVTFGHIINQTWFMSKYLFHQEREREKKEKRV